MELNKLIKELDEIIAKFNNENIELDDAIKYYEAGVKLSKDIKKILTEAKNKIEHINKEG